MTANAPAPTLHLAAGHAYAVPGLLVAAATTPPAYPVEFEVVETGRRVRITAPAGTLAHTATAPGVLVVRARFLTPGGSPRTGWSTAAKCYVLPSEQGQLAHDLRRDAHELDGVIVSDGRNTTVSRTDVLPPALRRTHHPAWFRTPAIEGSPPLLNELASYYEDPSPTIWT